MVRLMFLVAAIPAVAVSADASASPVGNRPIHRPQYRITRVTCVCCSMTSLIQMAYGSRVRRQGRSRPLAAYHCRMALVKRESGIGRYLLRMEPLR